MEIGFRIQPGEPSLGILFFWSLTLSGARPGTLSDLFIPELYYDYLYVQRGRLTIADGPHGASAGLPQQSLRGLFTRPFAFEFSTPLALFGARLSLAFAEHFWEVRLRPNALTEQAWVDQPPKSLGAFAAQVTACVQAHRARKYPYPLLGSCLEESAWLKAYSPRHKRRLYSAVFGVSRQALDRIHGLQSFLAQACGFDDRPPRLLEHINADIFYDQPHFNRTFRKLTGPTPVAYFAAPSHLQGNLMAASYNARADEPAML